MKRVSLVVRHDGRQHAAMRLLFTLAASHWPYSLYCGRFGASRAISRSDTNFLYAFLLGTTSGWFHLGTIEAHTP